MKNISFIFLILLKSFTGNAQLSQNALLFDGVNDRVIIPGNTAYNVGTGNLTLEAWIRADSPSGSSIWEYIVTHYATGNGTGFGLALAYNGTPSFTINGSGYGPGGTFNIRDGLCHHIAVVRKDTILSYYIDGVLLPGTSTSTAAINTTNPLCIGSYNSTVSPSPFKGLIKELRIWNIARTPSQLLSNMSAVLPANSTGLTGYWRMNTTSGQTVTDFSLTANSGVLGNTSSIETLDPAFTTSCPSCVQTTATVTAGGPVSFCIGDSVLLSSNTGVGFSYQWYKNGVAISGATGSTYYAKLSGAFSVKLTNASACVSWSNTIDVTQKLDNAGSITCSGYTIGPWACLNGGNTRTLSAGTGTGYTYQWKRNGVNINGATLSTYTTGLAGTYTCFVTSGTCSRTTSAFDLGPNPVTLQVINGGPTACTGPVNLIATRTYGGSGISYDWKRNGASVGAPSNYSYNASLSGAYTCVVTDAACPGTVTSNAIGVTIGTLPPVYISPVSTQVISDCSASNVFLEAVDANGNSYPNDPGITSIDWYFNGATVSGANSLYASESGVYSVYVNSSCGTVSSVQPKVLLMTNGSTSPFISYSSLVGCTQVALSVDNYWTSYQWKLNGANIAGATNWNYNATQSGTYSCQLFNACGSVTTPGVPVTVFSSGPLITTQNGTVICGGNYKLMQAPLGTGLSYQWKLNGTNIANATGFSYAANIAGSYTCQVSGTCGSFLSNVIVLTASSVPAVPGIITGTSRPCPGTTNYNYSNAPVANATTYVWSLPSGMNLVSGQGTTNVVVNFSPGFISGSIGVKSGNDCGNSAMSSKLIKTKAPATPAGISGLSNGICASNQSYSINAVNQATGYIWSVPAGVSVLSGQGTTTINVAINNSFSSDSIRVLAYNNCTSSASKAKFIKGMPVPPAVISGAVNVCAGQMGLVYSISPVYGATSYSWTKPAGAAITNGQGTTQLTMTMGSASGVVKVKATNSCGSSNNKSKTLNVVCRSQEIFNDEIISIYPNPSSGLFHLDFTSGVEESVSGVIYNGTGQIVDRFEVNDNVHLEIGEHYPPGVYLLQLNINSRKIHKKLVKL